MTLMKRTLGGAIAVAAFAAFLAANRGAYRGYFSDDDLDNIGWTTALPSSDFARGLISPRYETNHFRPVGHGTFAILGSLTGLRFEWYTGVVHLLHFATTVVLFGVLRKFGFEPWQAFAGAGFFLFQMALFDALWKPMYLFDLWCGLFLALALSSWMSGRFLVAFLFFWLAIKSKEHAVMFAGVVALYETCLGQRRWRQVATAGIIALVFVVQAATGNRDQGAAYTLSFTVPALIQTVSYYSSRILVLPYLGPALLLAAMLARDRRAWWGLASALLLMAPLLFLPGRMFTAYLYAPMIGIAVAVAAFAARSGWKFTAVASAAWLLLNFVHLRERRRAELASANDNRAYCEGVARFARGNPDLRRFVVSDSPEGMRQWGVQGALRIAYRTLDLQVEAADSANLGALFAGGRVGILHWNRQLRELQSDVREAHEKNASYIDFSKPHAIWQLGEGWYEPEGAYRWTRPRAAAILRRPAGAAVFEIKVNVGDAFIGAVKRTQVRVLIDGSPAGAAEFRRPGWDTVSFPVKTAAGGDATVEILAAPEFRPPNDPRKLGIAIGAFGFR
jgi:hypothetical protein